MIHAVTKYEITSRHAFDEEALMEDVYGDIALLGDMITILDEDSPALLEKIRGAAGSSDAAALAKLARKLKGMLGNFCAEPAIATASQLETMGREERLADVAEPAERVQRETEQLRAALHEFLKTK